jgi:hypothetical protein
MPFPTTADLGIANQALGVARARTQQITSFSQPGPEASQINLNYADTRDNLLRLFDWGFAKSTISLGNPVKSYDPTETSWTNAQPPPPWLYSYAMPANIVKVRAVFGQSVPGIIVPQVPSVDQGLAFAYYTYEVVNDGGVRVIVTNAPGALAVVTLGGLDPSVWDALFTQAMVALLAANICLPLSGDAQLADKLMKDAGNMIEMAKIASANETTDVQHIMPDWLRARGSRIYDEGISVGGVVLGGRDW